MKIICKKMRYYVNFSRTGLPRQLFIWHHSMATPELSKCFYSMAQTPPLPTSDKKLLWILPHNMGGKSCILPLSIFSLIRARVKKWDSSKKIIFHIPKKKNVLAWVLSQMTNSLLKVTWHVLVNITINIKKT